MATMVVMDILIFRTYCFDGYNFSSSSSSCVDSNDPYYINRWNGLNDCTGHKGSEGHNGYTGLFDNIDLSERLEILT